MTVWKVTWIDGASLREFEFSGSITGLLNNPQWMLPEGYGSVPTEYNIISIVRVARPVVGT